MEIKLRVFLCHSSQDKPAVRELYQQLLAEGWIDPWLDEEKLLPGQDRNLEIEKAVEKSDVVIVCLSSSSIIKEGYIQRELRKVLDVAREKPEGTIFIIPLRLDECDLPRSLNGYHCLDYFPDSRRQRNYRRLLQSLGERADKFSRLIEETKIANAGTFYADDVQSCSRCAGIFRGTDDVIRCGKCGSYYHWSCWSFERRCLNCGSREYRRV